MEVIVSDLGIYSGEVAGPFPKRQMTAICNYLYGGASPDTRFLGCIVRDMDCHAVS